MLSRLCVEISGSYVCPMSCYRTIAEINLTPTPLQNTERGLK